MTFEAVRKRLDEYNAVARMKNTDERVEALEANLKASDEDNAKLTREKQELIDQNSSLKDSLNVAQLMSSQDRIAELVDAGVRREIDGYPNRCSWNTKTIIDGKVERMGLTIFGNGLNSLASNIIKSREVAEAPVKTVVKYVFVTVSPLPKYQDAASVTDKQGNKDLDNSPSEGKDN